VTVRLLPVNEKQYYFRRGSAMNSKELKVPVEVYSRVVGYFRPVNQWNKGKQEEFTERVTYRLENAAIYEYQGNR
jgi:ribonucleoside-triphosphate reductase (formate)